MYKQQNKSLTGIGSVTFVETNCNRGGKKHPKTSINYFKQTSKEEVSQASMNDGDALKAASSEALLPHQDAMPECGDHVEGKLLKNPECCNLSFNSEQQSCCESSRVRKGEDLCLTTATVEAETEEKSVKHDYDPTKSDDDSNLITMFKPTSPIHDESLIKEEKEEGEDSVLKRVDLSPTVELRSSSAVQEESPINKVSVLEKADSNLTHTLKLTTASHEEPAIEEDVLLCPAFQKTVKSVPFVPEDPTGGKGKSCCESDYLDTCVRCNPGQSRNEKPWRKSTKSYITTVTVAAEAHAEPQGVGEIGSFLGDRPVVKAASVASGDDCKVGCDVVGERLDDDVGLRCNSGDVLRVENADELLVLETSPGTSSVSCSEPVVKNPWKEIMVTVQRLARKHIDVIRR